MAAHTAHPGRTLISNDHWCKNGGGVDRFQQIRDMLTAQPFEPFRIHLSNGQTFEIRIRSSPAWFVRRFMLASSPETTTSPTVRSNAICFTSFRSNPSTGTCARRTISSLVARPGRGRPGSRGTANFTELDLGKISLEQVELSINRYRIPAWTRR